MALFIIILLLQLDVFLKLDMNNYEIAILVMLSVIGILA